MPVFSRITWITFAWFIVWFVGLVPAAIASAVSMIAAIATLLFFAICSGSGGGQAAVAFGLAVFYFGIPIGIPAAVLLGTATFSVCVFSFAVVHIMIASLDADG